MKIRGYILSYVNPDTDGVCSSIAYSFLKRRMSGDIFKPVVFGTINKETMFVLKHFGVDKPERITDAPDSKAIILLDTHHKKQLPVNILSKNVIEIIDHHPAGDFNAFPGAIIQNEQVGAVATLITERTRKAPVQPKSQIAGILAAGIISNTLNLIAPSTSDRDRIALDWLYKYVNIDQEFIKAMFVTRSDISNKSTREVLLSDFKEYSIAGLRIGISQMEAVNISDFTGRCDLKGCLNDLKMYLGLDHLIFNGVDISSRHSTVVATGRTTQELLEAALEVEFNGSSAIFSRILLRKTELVPQIMKIMGK